MYDKRNRRKPDHGRQHLCLFDSITIWTSKGGNRQTKKHVLPMSRQHIVFLPGVLCVWQYIYIRKSRVSMSKGGRAADPWLAATWFFFLDVFFEWLWFTQSIALSFLRHSLFLLFFQSQLLPVPALCCGTALLHFTRLTRTSLVLLVWGHIHSRMSIFTGSVALATVCPF
jgi:hypothetical protein